MGRIADDKIQEVRDRVDIVEVVGNYLPLKRSGANHQGLCPFHQEKTPSFNVNAARQIFHCFGCGVGGDVFKFLMRMEGLAFPDAVRRLAEKVGIEVEEEVLSPAEQQRRAQRERLFKINQAAMEFYHQVLLEGPEGAAARRYLRRRGYDGEAVRAFHLGHAPEAWEALAGHLQEQNFKPEDVQATGLTRSGKQGRGDYDLFRNRLLFPIQDLQGRFVAFGGRVLDDSLPKYINSPESPVYHKGNTLYGLYQARDAMRHSDTALVTEGYFDVLALHRAGFANSVASCGTALTADHARLLKRFADKVLLVFDEDAAGRQATFRAMDALLPIGLAVSVVSLPSGDDPDSLIKAQGPEGFQACLDAARPVLEVFLEEQLQSQDASVEGRARAAEEVLVRIRRLPGDLERNLYVKRLAEKTGLDEGLLLGKLSDTPKAPSTARHESRTPSRPAPAPSPAARRPERVERSQAFLLRLMTLEDGRIRDRVREEGVANLFIDERYRGLAEYLLGREDADGRLPDDLVDSQLDDDRQALLTGIILDEGSGWAEDADRIFSDCRRTVSHGLLKARLRELEALEEDARVRGNDSQLERCQQERLKINMELKKKL